MFENTKKKRIPDKIQEIRKEISTIITIIQEADNAEAEEETLAEDNEEEEDNKIEEISRRQLKSHIITRSIK